MLGNIHGTLHLPKMKRKTIFCV